MIPASHSGMLGVGLGCMAGAVVAAVLGANDVSLIDSAVWSVDVACFVAAAFALAVDRSPVRGVRASYVALSRHFFRPDRRAPDFHPRMRIAWFGLPLVGFPPAMLVTGLALWLRAGTGEEPGGPDHLWYAQLVGTALLTNLATLAIALITAPHRRIDVYDSSPALFYVIPPSAGDLPAPLPFRRRDQRPVQPDESSPMPARCS
jgi:hypothetical protein